MTMMGRALPLLRRSLPSSSAIAAAENRFLHAAANRTPPVSASGSMSDSRSVPLGVAGALSFSIAAFASAAAAAEAKEPPSPVLVLKEVVLYQYEACPFCNKVKVS